MSFNHLMFPHLMCASSNDHIFKEPFALACSHGVCRNCKPNNSEAIECKICGTDQKITSNENVFMKIFIDNNFSGLFDKLEEQMSEEIRKYKGKLILMDSLRLMHFLFVISEIVQNRDSKFEAKIIFIEQEIEIKIQSMKDELDKFYDEFKQEVKRYKEEFVK